MLTDHPLLSIDDCRAIRNRIAADEDQWIDRGGGRGKTFHTLGAAAYLDFHLPRDGAPGYYDLAGRCNPRLRDGYGDVLDTVRRELERILAAPARWSERCALPGFHVFRGRGIQHAAYSGAHFDCQYNGLDLAVDAERDSDAPISFTLPVALPAAGGGLEVWNITSDEFRRKYNLGIVGDIHEYQHRAISRIHSYSLGTLTVHHDLVLHQIAPTDRVDDTDERITLQGHGLKVGGTWTLYW